MYVVIVHNFSKILNLIQSNSFIFDTFWQYTVTSEFHKTENLSLCMILVDLFHEFAITWSNSDLLLSGQNRKHYQENPVVSLNLPEYS